MAYDPADLKLPHWLLQFLDSLVAIRIPLPAGWKIGFTRAGIIFFAALLGVWAAALYSGNNLLYLCGAVITAILVASTASAARLLRNFPDPGALLPVLQAGSVTVLRQFSALVSPASAIVSVDWRDSAGCYSFVGRCEGGLLRLDGRISPEARGIYSCTLLTLSTDAPIGLLVLMLERRGGGEAVVMPDPVVWHPSALGNGGIAGQPAAGGELLDLRAYLPGDPLSRVHWRKASGDISSWKVKRFASDAADSQEQLLRVDLRLPAGMDKVDFEHLLGRVWFWVLEQGGHGKLLLGQQQFELGKESQTESLYRAIAAAEPELKPAGGEGGMLLSVSHE